MREKILLNDNWLFSKETSTISLDNKFPFETINLPHTWNNLDGQDGGGDYFRSVCAYKKSLTFTREDLTKDLYLEFEAIFSISKIYVNKKEAFVHKGGFQTFRVYLNPFINEGENEIFVLADNEPNKIVYPQFADFTFFGGIYRDVYLIKVNKSHFDLSYYGSKGFYAKPKLENGNWNVYLKSFIINKENNLLIKYEIYDEEKLINEISTTDLDEEKIITISNPHLWNGRIDPHLYKVYAKLYKKDELLDEVSLDIGLRTFRVDPETGFYLNDKPYHLHGVSRHQDRFNLGWALTKKEHEEDMDLIKEVGATTIRLAHYQHSQYFYELCDKEGMVVWAEIPYISAHMDSGKENVFSQMKELIIQNIHHPSIVCWGLSNEITMRGQSEQLIKDHKELNDFVHKEDPSRLTTLAAVAMLNMNSKMCKITDILSYNHYFGWYAGSVDQNGPWLDKFHSLNPNIPLGLSEYGCEAVLSWHSENPTQGDYSEEYQAYYHEEMLKTFTTRPYIWSTHVWNMFDFAADQRDEGGCKGRNNKGLVTFDRKTKKDSFYIYKAYWNKDDKFVHICSKRYKERSKEQICIKVYSNLSEVSLYANDELIGAKTIEDHKALFDVKLKDGENKIIVKSDKYQDEALFIKVDKEKDEYHLSNSSENITNWFDKEGNSIEFNFPENYLNIDSKFSELMKIPVGKAILNLVLKVASEKIGFGEGGNSEELLNMLGSTTIRRVASLVGGKIMTPQTLFLINEIVNKIKIDYEDPASSYTVKKVKFNNQELDIKIVENNLNVLNKFKVLLNNKFIFNIFELLKTIKKDNKPLLEIKGIKLLILKNTSVISLFKLIRKLPSNYISDLNEILIRLSKK